MRSQASDPSCSAQHQQQRWSSQQTGYQQQQQQQDSGGAVYDLPYQQQQSQCHDLLGRRSSTVSGSQHSMSQQLFNRSAVAARQALTSSAASSSSCHTLPYGQQALPDGTLLPGGHTRRHSSPSARSTRSTSLASTTPGSVVGMVPHTIGLLQTCCCGVLSMAHNCVWGDWARSVSSSGQHWFLDAADWLCMPFASCAGPWV